MTTNWKREAEEREAERKITEAQLNRALLHCRNYQAEVEMLRAKVDALDQKLREMTGFVPKPTPAPTLPYMQTTGETPQNWTNAVYEPPK